MFAQRITDTGVITAAEFAVIDREVASLIDDAVSTAKGAPLPTTRDLLTDVYVSY
jgi:TPP-dependent pyruvate/acetoin dehydrogenase alpha subunit